MAHESTPRLLAIFAHPDDESLGNGGMLAKCAAEGVETYLITATRGQQGWHGAPEQHPGLEALGAIREAELKAAAGVLGLRDVVLLDYVDGELDRADPQAIVDRLATDIRRLRPHVVVTFDSWGLYGHPDHIAISRFATEATMRAADKSLPGTTHAVDALYYMAWTRETIDLYESAFGAIAMQVDGQIRRPAAWPASAVSVRIDASEHWATAWEAIQHHRSQLPAYDALLRLPETFHRQLWSQQTYVRALSNVPFPPGVASTLFA